MSLLCIWHTSKPHCLYLKTYPQSTMFITIVIKQVSPGWGYLYLLPRILLINFLKVNLILTADPQHKGQRNFIETWLKSFHPSAWNISNFSFSHTRTMTLQLSTRLCTSASLITSLILSLPLSPSLSSTFQHLLLFKKYFHVLFGSF